MFDELKAKAASLDAERRRNRNEDLWRYPIDHAPSIDSPQTESPNDTIEYIMSKFLYDADNKIFYVYEDHEHKDKLDIDSYMVDYYADLSWMDPLHMCELEAIINHPKFGHIQQQFLKLYSFNIKDEILERIREFYNEECIIIYPDPLTADWLLKKGEELPIYILEYLRTNPKCEHRERWERLLLVYDKKYEFYLKHLKNIENRYRTNGSKTL